MGLWKTSSSSLTLVITLLLALSSTQVLPEAHAVAQSGLTTWSPFGPRTERLRFDIYSDFESMFAAFEDGQVDITDWPVPVASFSGYDANPDFFVTNLSQGVGFRILDRNYHRPFLGAAQLEPRTIVPASIANSATTSGCSTGTGRLVVNLKNQEVSPTTPLIDSLNTVKVLHTSGSPSASAFDQVTGQLLDGTYRIPGPTTCLIAGTYTLSTSVYSGTVSVDIPSGGVTTLDLLVNFNGASNSRTTVAGREVGKGIAHLLDKPSFMGMTNINGIADYIDIYAVPVQGLDYGAGPSRLPQAILDQDCVVHPWMSSCSPVSAYNLVSDVIGGSDYWWGDAGEANGANVGYSGLEDLRAACDHFVAAGFSLSGGNCLDVAIALSSSTAPSGAYAHMVNPSAFQVITYPRTDPLGRRAFATLINDAINALFGSPNGVNTQGGPVDCTVLYGTTCSPQFFTIVQVGEIVFAITGGALDDWDIYPGGRSTASVASQLYGLHTDFTGGVCAGTTTEEPGNYNLYCSPANDTESAAAQFSPDLQSANEFFKRSALVIHEDLPLIPVFSFASRSAALKGWVFSGLGGDTRSSLVNELRRGFRVPQSFSFLNMRQNPSVSVNNPLYTPGGGDSQLIRRGFSQQTYRISPYHYLTVWEWELGVQLLYDTLLKQNPRTGGSGVQLMDWSTTSHSSSFNPTEVSCTPKADGSQVCETGTTTQIWRLRNDLKFHDGTPVEAHDVVFSLVTIRDVPSANLQSGVITMASATALDATTVQVKLKGQSLFYEWDVGSLPILPQHVWDQYCNWPTGVPQPAPSTLAASQCGNPGFDPMDVDGAGPGTQGIMIGHGPFICRNLVTNALGGTCSQNANGSPGGQWLSAGARVFLERYTGYHRGVPGVSGSSLHRYSFADKNNDGTVNILDIADAALHFGTSDTYWDSPLFGVTGGTVDIGEIATVAFYFDHGLTKPYRPDEMIEIDPEIDPFCSPTDC